MAQDKAEPVTSAFDPDLGAIRLHFITDMIARGAIALLITSIIGLLARMREQKPHSCPGRIYRELLK